MNKIAAENEVEEFVPMKGFENLYEISPNGKIKTLRNKNGKRGALLKPYIDSEGYERVALYREDGTRIWIGVHKAVAETFLPNPRKCEIVNHLNYIRNDNRVENLEWCTAKENVEWSKEHYKGVNHKKVRRIDANGVSVEFASISDGARASGTCPPNICRAIKTGNRSGGYYWSVVDIADIPEGESESWN